MSSHIKNRKPMFPVRACRKPVFPALHLLARQQRRRRPQHDAWWMPNRRRRKIRKRMRKSKNQFLRFSVARLIAVTSHLAGGSLLLRHIEGNFVDPTVYCGYIVTRVVSPDLATKSPKGRSPRLTSFGEQCHSQRAALSDIH